MSNGTVVTSQPVPSAPTENINLEKPNTEDVVLTQPMLKTENVNDMLTRADDDEMERRRRRNEDFCCYACADSYTETNDAFCWYFFCRMLCNGCGHCCQACDSCCDGCADCCHECCTGGDNGGGCCDCGDTGCCDGGDGGCCDGGCCDGGSGDSGDCDCGDCDCGDCDCSCL